MSRNPLPRVTVERNRLRTEAHVRRMVEENRSRPPLDCQCGRGPVETLFGCQQCTVDHGTAYEQELMSMSLKQLLRRH